MKYKPYHVYKDSGIDWLGEVPEHWHVKRLRFLVTMNPSKQKVSHLPKDTEVSFIPMEAVGDDGKLDLERTRTIEEAETGYTYFAEGDVTYAKITPCFENGKGAVMRMLVGGAGFGTTELTVLRPSLKINSQFLYYLTISSAFRKLGEGSMYGAGGQKRVPDDFARNFEIGWPDVTEQQYIANFLARETGRLDTLIEKKRRIIELLKEKRIALISHAVTKGLDPNVKMKDSGIEWIGKMPVHWEILPFTKYVTDKSDYRGATPEKVQDGVFLVTAKNVRMGYIDYESSQEYVREEDYSDIMRRGLPHKGDILFTTEAPLGNVALVDREDIALAQRIIRFRMMPKRFDGVFTLFAMMAGYFQAQLASLSTGSTAEGLKASKLNLLWLVAPRQKEQRIIADFLACETSKIDRMLEKVEAAIEKLTEYRTALITAAVTGKIDVREAAT